MIDSEAELSQKKEIQSENKINKDTISQRTQTLFWTALFLHSWRTPRARYGLPRPWMLPGAAKILASQGSDLISPAPPHSTMPPRLRHNQITSIYSLALLAPSPPPLCLLAQSRRFSATSHANHLPSQRSVFFTWVNGPGAIFKQAGEEGPKYISAYDKYTWERKELEMDSPALVTPYPHNRSFRSQPVLSDQMREEIYSRVQIQGKSVRQVSAELAVSLDRVAAVVRLKAVEKKWVDSVSGFTFPF